MDIVTIVLVFILGVLGGGVGTAAVGVRKKRNRTSFTDALKQKIYIDENLQVSVFDVYWDLGVSDFALEIMAKGRLIPEHKDDVDLAHERIRDAVRAHGSYSAFIADTLDAIQEFYDEHTVAGARRDVPQLTTSDRKSIKMPAISGDQPPPDEGAVVPYRGYRPVTSAELGDRVAARSGGVPVLAESGDGIILDLDEIGVTKPLDFLSGLFDGTIGNQVERWFEMRQLRLLKQDLDRRLSELYDFYARVANDDRRFFDPIYDTAKRWDLEVERIERLSDKQPWKGRTFSMAGELLTEQALYAAKALAGFARINVDRTLERIHTFARRGNSAMAGYLVYLNHHAFFAGRGDGYGEYVRRIDTSAYRVQQELRNLHMKGVI